ncbi:MAG: permease, partial [Geminicoccaceae bacterium]|nr:permease [Geminicoccaceae bacterium]
MSVFTDIVERLRAIVFRAREEREFAEELQFHADMEAHRLEQAGVNAHEARRRSYLTLGGVERVKEDARDARGTRLFHDVGRDLGYAVRSLRQHPGFAIVAILTLALGIGGTTAVFSAVDAVLLQPLPYEQPGQLVRLYQADSTAPGARAYVTPVHFVDYRREMSAFEAAAAVYTYSETGADIGSGDDVRRIRVLPVSAGYFDVVSVLPRLGRGFQPDEENGELLVVLSDRIWRERYRGDASAVGQRLTMSGQPFTIVGVMPSGYEDPLTGPVDAWIPLDLAPARDPDNAGNHYLSVVARLRAGVSITRAQSELARLNATLAARYPDANNVLARVDPLKEDVVGSADRALGIMLGAVVLVLVLVCVNIANLLLVRGSDRSREFALRSALGAERRRLVRQTLIESLTLALVGAAVGLAVARLAMSAIVALGGASIPRLSELSLEPRLLVFSVLIATVSAMGFGLAPAFRAAGTDPGDVLREQTRASTSGAAKVRLREWLVVSQVALAFILLVGAGLLLVSLENLRDVELGVDPAGVLTFELHLPDARYDSTARARFYEESAARLASIPGARAAGGVSRLPATGDYHVWGTRAMTGPNANTERGFAQMQQRVVAGDYFGAAGIPLLDGRLFDDHDASGAPLRVVVSRRAADILFPGVPAVGQQVRAGGRTAEIIGVVGDVALDARGEIAPYVYHAHRQFAGNRNWALTQIVRTSGPMETVQSEARRALTALDPQLVLYRPAPLSDVIGRSEAQRVFTLQMLGAFAGVALALAALGLFGVLSYGVRLRSREFGIRMALGADRRKIRRMVLREGLAVTAI